MNNNNKSQFPSTKKAITKWLDKHKIKNYTINDDLNIDVNGDVDISHGNLKNIPIKFGNVTGSFNCCSNQLTSLIGSPKTVSGSFYCSFNQLTTLAGSPETVGGSFYCDYNQLATLGGSPEVIGDVFACVDNKLISLIELINCNFKEKIYFNIDENNFQPKELIQALEKYYVSHNRYELTNYQLHEITKSHIEKEILKNKLSKSKIKIKMSFI